MRMFDKIILHNHTDNCWYYQCCRQEPVLIKDHIMDIVRRRVEHIFFVKPHKCQHRDSGNRASSEAGKKHHRRLENDKAYHPPRDDTYSDPRPYIGLGKIKRISSLRTPKRILAGVLV